MDEKCYCCKCCCKKEPEPVEIKPGQVWYIHKLDMVLIVLKARVYKGGKKRILKGYRWVSLYHWGEAALRYGDATVAEMFIEDHESTCLGTIEKIMPLDALKLWLE